MNMIDFNSCVTQYSDAIFRYVRKMNIEEMIAEDITQKTFIKLWKNHTDVDMPTAKSWLFTTAYRTMIDTIRKEKKETEKKALVSAPTQYEDKRLEQSEIIELALTTLREEERRAILLRDYEGFSYDEIAEIMECTLSKTKTLIFRGRKKLSENVELKTLYLK